MTSSQWNLEFASDSSIMIEAVESRVSIVVLFEALRRERVFSGLIKNLRPAYNTLLLEFEPSSVSPQALFENLRRFLKSDFKDEREDSRLIEIPVVYGGASGPDLNEVAEHNHLTASDFIRKHSSVIYEVAFLGFSPGFPYLKGLPPELHCPRKPVPRLRVPAGSVAIGGAQTGIYPAESPGGWQIIGCTSLKLFDLSLDQPTLLQPGDRVRFRPETANVD